MCSEIHQVTEEPSLNVSSSLTPRLLHQRWGLHIYVCLSFCRNRSFSVVMFSVPLCKPKLNFFVVVLSCATSLLFTVLSLFLVEETAALILETEGVCFQMMQEWAWEFLCRCFPVAADPVDTSPLALSRCSVSNRAASLCRLEPFSYENLRLSVL